MKKWEKNPDISDNSLCTGHASGRIGNSALAQSVLQRPLPGSVLPGLP